MATYDPIIALVRPRVGGGCPLAAQRWAILQTVRRFCKEARVLRRTIIIDIEPGIARYQATTNWPTTTEEETLENASLEICGIRAVEVRGIPYTPALPWTFSQYRDGADQFVIYDPDSFELFPTPMSYCEEGLRVTPILRPKIEAQRIPDLVVSLYGEEVAGGSVAFLKGMLNEAWSDPAGAETAERKFRSDIALAKARADMQSVPHSFTVKAYV